MRLQMRIAVFAILCFLSSEIARAQFGQYILPGGPEQRPESREDRFKEEIEQARYHLGPVRVATVVGFQDVAYVRNLLGGGGGPTSDLTATLVAGFRAYLHTGPKVVWIADVLPEYVWWRRRTGSRRLDRTYEVEGLGFFNRLTLDVLAGRSERQQIVSPEALQPVNSGTDQGQVDAEVRLTGTLYPFATARRAKQSNLLDEVQDPTLQALNLLDRTDESLRGGVRFRPHEGVMIGLGAERSQSDFKRRVDDASNSGTAPVVEVLLFRPRFLFEADLADRSLAARQGSRFVDFHGVTGSTAVSIGLGHRLEVWTYAYRNLVYSLARDYPYLDDRRLGMSLNAEISPRAGARFFIETGRDDYVAFAAGAPPRADDLRSYGGSLRISLPAHFNLVAQAVRTRYTSNFPGAGRSFTSGGLTVTYGGNLQRR